MKDLFLRTKGGIVLLIVLLLPICGFAQIDGGAADAIGGFTEDLRGLHGVITQLYDDQKGQYLTIITASSTILAVGISVYIFSRVYRSLLAAEPIDWWGLTKPITVFLMVLFYPVILGLIEVCLSPISNVTGQMNYSSYNRMIEAKKNAIKNSEEYEIFFGNNGEGDFDVYFEKYGNDATFSEDINKSISRISFGAQQTILKMRYQLKLIISEILRLFYETAILAINFIRTFYLIILAVLGPIAFALSIFKGFSNMPFQWLGQFISKWLWLPIANVLATMLNTVQLDMIERSALVSGEAGAFFTPTDFGNLVFLIIGIIAFTCVPSVASMAIQVSGAGAGALSGKASQAASAGAGKIAGGAGIAAGVASGGVVTATKAAKRGAGHLYDRIKN